MVGISKESVDLVAKRIEELKKIIPEAFTEGKLDVNKLKQALGDEIETSGERYSFSWAGKSASIKLRDKRSKATLTPSRKESVDFDETHNIFVEGENLEVLKILQKAYQGKVKMIYIDPPYNTGKDFVYKDDFTDPLKNYLIQTGQLNEKGEKTTTNTETSGRYHSNWLSMMYPRLALARNLLSEDGVIFVSIDDNEVHNLRMIMNEIFGEENFISQFTRSVGTVPKTTRGIQNRHDYVLCYAKTILVEFGIDEDISEEHFRYDDNDGRGKYALIHPLDSGTIQYSSSLDYPINYAGKTFFPGQHLKDKRGKWLWRWSKELVEWGINNNLIVEKNNRLYTKNYRNLKIVKNEKGYQLVEKPVGKPFTSDTFVSEDFGNRVATRELKSILGGDYFDYPKPTSLIKKLIQMSAENNSMYVLDFFAGSGTTAQAVLEQNAEDGGNRKFILVQLPEPTPEDSEARKAGYKTIADICKERIRRVIKKIKEERKQKKLEENGKLDLGFKVFKLSKSKCFVWDEEETSDPNTLAKYIEESAKGASNAEPEALLYEVMLREGFALDSQIVKVKHGKNEFYQVNDGTHRLFACFDAKIDDEAVKQLALEKDDKLIVLDSALTDTQKVNLARKMRIETI